MGVFPKKLHKRSAFLPFFDVSEPWGAAKRIPDENDMN
jgi:hypothetical protein